MMVSVFSLNFFSKWKSLFSLFMTILSAISLNAENSASDKQQSNDQDLFISLKVPLRAMPRSIHPGLSQTHSDRWIMQSLHSGLFEWIHPAKIVPATCDSFTKINDKKWAFNLSKNARWSTGEPVLAQDFLRTWQQLSKESLSSDHPLLQLELIGSEKKYWWQNKFSGLIGVSAPSPHQLIINFKRPMSQGLILQALADERLAPVHQSMHQPANKQEFLVGPSNGPFFVKSFSKSTGIETAPNPYFCRDPIFLGGKECRRFDKKIVGQKSFNLAHQPTLYSPFGPENNGCFDEDKAQKLRVCTSQMLLLKSTGVDMTQLRSLNVASALALLLEENKEVKIDAFNSLLQSSSILPSNETFSPLRPRWAPWSWIRKKELALEFLKNQSWDATIRPLKLIIFCKNLEQEAFLKKVFRSLSHERGIECHYLSNSLTAVEPDALTVRVEVIDTRNLSWFPDECLINLLTTIKKDLYENGYYEYFHLCEDMQNSEEFSDMRCQEYREIEAFLQRTHFVIPVGQKCYDYYFSDSIVSNCDGLNTKKSFQDPNGFLNWSDLNFFSDSRAPNVPLAPLFLKCDPNEETS